MKKFSMVTIVLWVLAVLFFLVSFSFIGEGNIGAFITGVVISAVLGFVGWKKKDAKPAAKAVKSYVYVVDGSNVYHYNPNCGGMKAAKLITVSKAHKLGKKPCSKCTSTGSGYYLVTKEK